MLQKITNIILVAILLATTTGFTLSKHYCGEKLVSVAINQEAESCCGDGNCCQHESSHFELKDDFVVSVIQFSFQDVVTMDLHAYANLLFSFMPAVYSAQGLLDYSDTSPPPKKQTVLAFLQVYLL